MRQIFDLNEQDIKAAIREYVQKNRIDVLIDVVEIKVSSRETGDPRSPTLTPFVTAIARESDRKEREK